MALTEHRLGEFIELRDVRNSDLQYGADDVRGVNNLKLLMSTKADLEGRDLSKFQIVYHDEFVFNHRTSRNGSKFSIAYNDTDTPVICTEDYVVFRIKETCKPLLDSRWLYMFFNRPEFDRYVITNSWGSSTEFYNWEDICEVDIPVPPIEIQKKYAAIYNAMLANQQSYAQGLDDLKVVCDAYIENLRRKQPSVPIGRYLRECDEKNSDLSVTLTQGVDVNMQFIPAKREAADKESTRIVRTGQFAFNKVVKSNGTKLPIALRSGPDCIISGSYQVFEVVDKVNLLPEYLMMWLSRPETQRKCGFNAWGSTRDIFLFEELCRLEFPVPNIETQQYIVNIYNAYQLRKEILKQLIEQIKHLCPILIKGSVEEASA